MRLHDVSFRYHHRGPWVLRGVTLDIAPGEVAVVQGRNGAGKSTLLQLFAGILRPTRGRISDRPARVGWVPERFPADQPFTVAGYLSAMAAVIGDHSAVGDWIERLGLAPVRHVKLAELSKGTAQKVGLAQALLVRPDLLVLDEPWEGLDQQARLLVPMIVSEVAGTGGAVLVSDHRGETARLVGAHLWTVADAGVTTSPTTGQPPWLIEVAVAASAGPGVVADLRAAGHAIVRVRTDALAPADAHLAPGALPIPDAFPGPDAVTVTDGLGAPDVLATSDAPEYRP